MGKATEDAFKAESTDGLLGLSPNLGSNRQTYGQYLKKIGMIDSDSISIEYDLDSENKFGKKQGNLTFGKYNSSLP